MNNRLQWLKRASTFGLIFSFTACAQELTKAPITDEEMYQPFSIVFDKEHKPLVLDSKGKRLDKIEVDFPLKAEAVLSMEAISAIQIHGSHYYIIQVGGDYYKVPLPH